MAFLWVEGICGLIGRRVLENPIRDTGQDPVSGDFLKCLTFRHLGRILALMSEPNEDLSAKFSPEDWTLIKSGPLLAGLLVTLSDLRSGIFGAIKEGLAPSQAIIEAGAGASNAVVASVVASIKEMASKRERLQPPISIGGKKPEEVKAEVISQLAKISAILEGKVPADQADGYKSWLLAVAGKVANAATEGGIFGFGGEKVSAAETAAINELASSLGVKA